MENENINPQAPSQTQQTQQGEGEEKKPERIDELDIVGGALVRLVIGGFNRIKQLFIPHKSQ